MSFYRSAFNRFSQGGFSLTEVMIGGAILAGVGLGAAQMFKDQKKAQSLINSEKNLANFHANLVKHISNAKNCNATFRHLNNFPSSSFPSTIPSIFSCENCNVENVKYTAANSIGTTPYISENSWIENVQGATNLSTRTWRIAPGGLGIVPFTGGTGRSILRVTYELNPDINGGNAKRVTKDVNLNLRFTKDATPVFRECMSSESGNVTNLQNDICLSMTQVSSSGRIMNWNDNLGRCEVVGDYNNPLKRCPDNHMAVGGIQADGTVQCKSLTDGVPPSNLVNPGACAAGQGVRLYMSGGRINLGCI